MDKIEFKYSDGTALRINDKVLVSRDKIAKIERIFYPGTQASVDYAAPHGGFLLVFEDGDVQVWPDTDEDIALLARSD